MTMGRVNAIALNLRATPGGTAVGVLRQNCPVEILSQSAGWYQVNARQDGATLHGWVAANYVSLDTAGTIPPPTVVPIPDDATHAVTQVNNAVIAPDGQTFGYLWHPTGYYVPGTTSLTAWLSIAGTATGISPSSGNVLQAVINNEGHMEAVNSYDDAFLSFGLEQWTSGAGNEPGELAGLLQELRTLDPAAFQDCFGRYNLDVAPGLNGSPPVGFLLLGGVELGTAAAKQVLRSADWAYRFWRAGHVESVRRAQANVAAQRIRIACSIEVRGRPAGAWMTSEQGVALVLDEHVNRPSDVRGTLTAAVDAMIAGGTSDDPAQWGDAQEAELIRRYIAQRNTTRMTDSAKRAEQIARCVQQGMISDRRGSYRP